MSDINRKVGSKIKEIRNKKGLTQAELAEITNLSTNYISYIETGKKSASVKTLEKIAFALNTTIIELFKPAKIISYKNPISTSKKTQISERLNSYLKNRNPKDVKLILDIAKKVLNKK